MHETQNTVQPVTYWRSRRGGGTDVVGVMTDTTLHFTGTLLGSGLSSVREICGSCSLSCSVFLCDRDLRTKRIIRRRRNRRLGGVGWKGGG